MSRHQITPGNTTVPELQNRCAGESWQAGSIPVRLREGNTVRTPGTMLWGWMWSRLRFGAGEDP
jgi:hypothetical protein